MKRDLRDPQKMGEAYLLSRKLEMSIEDSVKAPAPPYENGPWMSSDPADHHSKTKQTEGDLSS